MSRSSSRSSKSPPQRPPVPPPPRRPSRRTRGPLVGAAILIAVGALVALSVQRVAPGERAFRVPRGGGVAVRLAPGWRVIVPVVQRVVRVPADPLAAAGERVVRSPEGAALRAPWHVEASLPDDAVAGFIARGVDPVTALGREADEAIAAWTRDAAGDALVLGEGRAPAEQRLAERLKAQGFEAVSARLGPVEGPAGMREALSARVLKERSVATGLKVALIGLDGADWEVIDPMVARGRLPNLARLKAAGAWGPLRSMDPMLSPLLWTTAATGKPPEIHGIIDFLVRDTRTGKPVPVSSRGRRVKALWNMLSDAGRTSAVIAWWATWPAERIAGHIVSDRVAYSTFAFTPGLDD